MVVNQAGRALLVSMLALVLGACAGLTTRPVPPRVTLVTIQMLKADLLQQRYGLRLNIQNPNDFALSLKGVDFHVDLNAVRFADGVAQTAVEIPAFGEAEIEVQVVSTIWNLARQLQGIGAREQERMTYRLYGDIAVAGFVRRLAFDEQGEIPLLPPADAR